MRILNGEAMRLSPRLLVVFICCSCRLPPCLSIKIYDDYRRSYSTVFLVYPTWSILFSSLGELVFSSGQQQQRLELMSDKFLTPSKFHICISTSSASSISFSSLFLNMNNNFYSKFIKQGISLRTLENLSRYAS